MERKLLCLIFSLLLGALNVCGQNRLNKNKQKTGRWVVYSDKAQTKKLFEGRFRNGNAVGKTYYYTLAGKLDRKEISRFGKLYTTVYYENGIVHQKGKARIVNTDEKISYYFYGRWKYYDTTGKLLKYCFYDQGHIVRTEYLDKTIKINDSLMYALNALEKRFNENNRELLDSISYSRFNASRRERLQLELYLSDTTSFRQIERILDVFGYPGKDQVQDAIMIPFYILSFAPSYIKEKHLPALIKSANEGEISWKSLAFFIDKLLLEQGKKQVYGTQAYLSQNEWVQFPVEQPDSLRVRRLKVGFED